jgi:septal ring factor EnvC (AmiA/AmiB activator)
VRLLLSGENPSEVARQLHYLAVLSRAAANAIRSYRADLAELGHLREASERRAAELRTLEARERADRGRLMVERRERRRVLDRIAGELRSGQRRMRQLQADEQRLSRVVREISRVLASRPGAGYSKRDSASGAQSDARPFESLRGQLGLPVRGKVTLRFRAPKGGRPGSKGLFIRAPQGEPVKAVAAGRVVFADWMRGFGNLLIVDHGEAYLSVYGNNESLLKRTGDAVSAGETVATVGASGGRQESGVYFELRHLGEAFDPMRWMGRQ